MKKKLGPAPTPQCEAYGDRLQEQDRCTAKCSEPYDDFFLCAAHNMMLELGHEVLVIAHGIYFLLRRKDNA